jgi:hypothetical protein
LAYATQKSFVMDSSNSCRLLVGTNRVYESTNGGDSWAPISDVLTLSTTASDQYITALAIAPSDPNTVFAGTANGHLFVTHDDGGSWADVGMLGLPENVYNPVVNIQIDPSSLSRMFLVTGSSTGSRVWELMSTPLLSTWGPITGDLPDSLTPRTLAVDWRYTTPVLYLGTERGLFASLDNGSHWEFDSSAGLPRADVQDLYLDPGSDGLYAATYGRGAWMTQAAGPAVIYEDFGGSGNHGSATPFDFTVVAVDSAGHPALNYTGTISFSSTDDLASLPGAYTFTLADRGVHTFHGLVLRTPGQQTLTLSGALGRLRGLTSGVLVTGLGDLTYLVSVQVGPQGTKAAGGKMRERLTLVNEGRHAISGPFWLVLDNLNRHLKLRRRKGLVIGVTRSHQPLGSPYEEINVPMLQPGQHLMVTLSFLNPTGRRIHFTPRLLAGTGQL